MVEMRRPKDRGPWTLPRQCRRTQSQRLITEDTDSTKPLLAQQYPKAGIEGPTTTGTKGKKRLLFLRAQRDRCADISASRKCVHGALVETKKKASREGFRVSGRLALRKG